MSEHDTDAPRPPTPDELIRWVRALKYRSIFPKFSETIPKLTMMADALEAQRDQIQQAREIIDALNRLRHLSSGSAIIARLDPILEKAAAFKRANPAPAATKENPRD